MTGQPIMSVQTDERRRISEGVDRIFNRLDALERDAAAARRELEHVLSILPFEHAKTGKYRKLRRRLERFLSERLEGL